MFFKKLFGKEKHTSEPDREEISLCDSTQITGHQHEGFWLANISKWGIIP